MVDEFSPVAHPKQCGDPVEQRKCAPLIALYGRKITLPITWRAAIAFSAAGVSWSG